MPTGNIASAYLYYGPASHAEPDETINLIRSRANMPSLTNGFANNQFRIIYLALAVLLSANGKGQAPIDDSLKFYPASDFTVLGRFHTDNNYQRLPLRYKGVVRDDVWMESENSAGIAIRFNTNAKQIVVRWMLKEAKNYEVSHSAGLSGVDLYTHVKSGWQYVGTGLPKGRANRGVILRRGDGSSREYLLNLSLYNTIDSLWIGVPKDAGITRPKDSVLTPGRPVVYYGSSITQGASASRPGMAYTNILSRKLEKEFYNFGFNGEGTFDLSVGQAMSEVDAALFVIDCTPNSKIDIIRDSAVKLVRLLRNRKPSTPILLVEGYYHEDGFFNEGETEKVRIKNQRLTEAYAILRKEGVTLLYYKKGNGMIGYDHEGTEDGTHPNDLGMSRFAENILPDIKALISKQK